MLKPKTEALSIEMLKGFNSVITTTNGSTYVTMAYTVEVDLFPDFIIAYRLLKVTNQVAIVEGTPTATSGSKPFKPLLASRLIATVLPMESIDFTPEVVAEEPGAYDEHPRYENKTSGADDHRVKYDDGDDFIGKSEWL